MEGRGVWVPPRSCWPQSLQGWPALAKKVGTAWSGAGVLVHGCFSSPSRRADGQGRPGLRLHRHQDDSGKRKVGARARPWPCRRCVPSAGPSRAGPGLAEPSPVWPVRRCWGGGGDFWPGRMGMCLRARNPPWASRAAAEHVGERAGLSVSEHGLAHALFRGRTLPGAGPACADGDDALLQGPAAPERCGGPPRSPPGSDVQPAHAAVRAAPREPAVGAQPHVVGARGRGRGRRALQDVCWGWEGAVVEDTPGCKPPLCACACSPPAPFCPQPIPTGYPAGESNINMMVSDNLGSSFPR